MAVLGVAIAAGLGVFAALRIDRALERRAETAVPAEIAAAPTSRTVAIDANPLTMDFRGAAKRINPSVVAVDKFQRVRRSFFDETGANVETGSGSGVILSKDGTIVTNNHVVEGASEVRVRLNDKRTFRARVVGRDPLSDIAVLRIDAPNLVPVTVGASKELQVGQWVIAVGNPLGFDNTVSVGVVSSLTRQLPTDRGGAIIDAVQTDAAINPGNSGGALCDADGRLVGINTAIVSGTGQSVGIGFAIPVDRVRAVAKDLISLGYVRYARLGVGILNGADHALADPEARRSLAREVGAEDVPDYGLIVGDGAGTSIRPLDVILSVDGQKVDAQIDLWRILTPRKPGDAAKVVVWRAGERVTLNVPLKEFRSGSQ